MTSLRPSAHHQRPPPPRMPNWSAIHLRRPHYALLLLLSLTALLGLLSAGSMRLCVPFSLTRISSSAHARFSCAAGASKTAAYSTQKDVLMSMTGGQAETRGGRLADWLQSQKEAFLSDLEGGDVKGWTVAVGNEAGDLDSLASSIGYASLASTLQAKRSIPLILTPATLIHLRPENILALQHASIPTSSLLHASDLTRPSSELARLGARFALVDHNTLLPPFRSDVEDSVAVILDHHADEGSHPGAERIIQVPTGSCASLVAQHFRPQWEAAMGGPAGKTGGPVPSELATLLIESILIDTGGLKTKAKGDSKTTATDVDAASFLLPLSTLPGQDGQLVSLSEGVPDFLKTLTDDLFSAKSNVTALNTRELLLRDYKEYELPTASPSRTLRVGLSTVPLGLKPWLSRPDGGWADWVAAARGWMDERNLDVEGVLTTYRSDKGNHKRELVLVVRSSAADFEALVSGLEGDAALALALWGKKDGLGEGEGIKALTVGGGFWGKVWQQGNASATRKQVAPLIRDIISRIQGDRAAAL